MISLNSLYKKLGKLHGEQGWWPIVDAGSGASVYKENTPKNQDETFEVFIGAILTQGVSWKNVEKAVYAIKKKSAMSPAKLARMPEGRLGLLIRPTGYFNQKAKKIKNFLRWFKGYGFSFKEISTLDDSELRPELLSVTGIGPETADSMLNYGLNRKIFVVDAYTKRLFSRLGILGEGAEYHEIQAFVQKKFRGDIADYKEFHALIVAHCSSICKKKPLCESCSLKSSCSP